MDEFPVFHFTQSQASVYEIVAEHRPDLLGRIATKIREGRWEVAASHWVECDKNLVGGESLARHLLYSRRYLKVGKGRTQFCHIRLTRRTPRHAHSVVQWRACATIAIIPPPPT